MTEVGLVLQNIIAPIIELMTIATKYGGAIPELSGLSLSQRIITRGEGKICLTTSSEVCHFKTAITVRSQNIVLVNIKCYHLAAILT